MSPPRLREAIIGRSISDAIWTACSGGVANRNASKLKRLIGGKDEL
jgi:hypothetical protein